MREDTQDLPFWDGFEVADLELEGHEVAIRLRPRRGVVLRCGRCQAACASVHEWVARRIRDLPMMGHPVRLEVSLARVACERCGQCMQHVSWLAPHARLTRRLQQAAAHACSMMAVSHVARWLGLHWSTVRALERQRLLAQVQALPAPRPRRLIMDEFALFKGHRYASVILDADTGRVLWVGEGRSRQSVRPFFQSLGVKGCARIQAVAMDMNSAFDLEVRHHCRQARIVYDLFHVVAKYAREVISRVRVDAANRLRQDKPARRVVKQAHWLLLRNRSALSGSQQIRLDEVLQANQPLMTAYVMNEQLKALWTAPDAWEWRRRWKQWLGHAQQSGIAALQRFASTLKPYWRGILSRVRWPMHTGKLEGINNRIKLIKRMAYGYRDTDFFFLKIKAAFPGNP